MCVPVTADMAGILVYEGDVLTIFSISSTLTSPLPRYLSTTRGQKLQEPQMYQPVPQVVLVE